MTNKLHSIIGAYLARDASGRTPDFNKDGGLKRTFEVRSVDSEKRTVELSFSSEIEYERWFGIEILDHSPGAMRMERMQGGAALLVNHDWDDQVGVVESVSIGDDRRGRAVVRFGRSARAEEIFQDVVDGIRKLVSVGYRVHAAKLVETRDGVDVYRIIDWEPYEISLVSVPADPSVGVGRKLENPQEESTAGTGENSAVTTIPAESQPNLKDRKMNERILRDAAGNLVRAQVDDAGNIVKVLETLEKAGAEAQRGTDAERARVRAITELGRSYNATLPASSELAMQYISEGKTPEEFQRALLDKMNERISKPLSEQSRSAEIGMDQRDLRRYSLLRVVRAMAPNATRTDREAAAFEFECSEAAQRQYGREARGVMIPADVLSRGFNAGGAANTPAGATSGANLVATELLSGSFIEMLRNRTTIMRLGSVMGGLVGNVDIPKQTGGATAYWLGEGADATEGTPTVGQISLSPKTVAAYTDITRQLAMQSSPDAESIVLRDLRNALSQAIDYAGYYGSGASNQPKGLKNYSGINAKDFAAANPTYAELVEMESLIAADNADVDSMGYVVNAMMRGALKTTQKFSGTNGAPVWEPGNTVNGYRAEVTNQVANGDVFFGNFADLVVALWGGLDLTVDPYSLSKSGGLRLVVFQSVDFVLRRVESICYGSATVTP